MGRWIRRFFLILVALLLFAAPFVIWFAYTPSRVLVPALAPVTCGERRVCVDDVNRLAEAEALYSAALAFVNDRVGQIQNPPPVYFCATAACSAHFGWEGVAGYNVGVFGAVIKPGWWKSFIVRHELIHHLQNERFGMLNYVATKPQWFLEGMAYTLSEDPRRSFSGRGSLDADRKRFEAWYRDVGRADLWEQAGVLTRNP